MREPTGHLYIGHLAQIPTRDCKYFLGFQGDDIPRNISRHGHESGLEGLTIQTMDKLPRNHTIKAIIGASVFCASDGISKYQIHILSGNESFPNDMSSYQEINALTRERARLAEEKFYLNAWELPVVESVDARIEKADGDRHFVFLAIAVDGTKEDLGPVYQLLLRKGVVIDSAQASKPRGG